MPPLDRWAEEAAAAAAAERLRSRQPDRPLRRFEAGLLAERIYPARHHGWIVPKAPGPDVAFLTVANDRFFRGLEALLLSLLEVYSDFQSPLYVLHDGTLVPFLQRRLLDIYDGLIFEEPKPSWWHQDHGSSANQRRIGGLGYLNTHALHLRGYRRVIVLDSDLLIEGALDPLWAEGDAVRAVADCGDTAYAVISSITGRPVINSGVLSIPGCLLNDEQEQRMEALIHNCLAPFCPLLDSFADQKVWNQFLMGLSLELLPINFNCNIKYLMKYLDGFVEGLSVIHFTGHKPWLCEPWTVQTGHRINRSAASASPESNRYWNQFYRKLLYKQRLLLYRRTLRESLPSVQPGSSVLIAKEPVDLKGHSNSNYPVHLVIADPWRFGVNWMHSPVIPADWHDSLSSLASECGVIAWSTLELKPLLEQLLLPLGVKRRYVLIEAPYSPDIMCGLDTIARLYPDYLPAFQCDEMSIMMGVVSILASP